MIDLGRLLAVTDVYFHRNCADGTAAAAICAAAFKALGTSPEFHSLQVGTRNAEDVDPRPGQMFVDITPPMPRWREWVPFSPVILDHHETSREATEGLGGVYKTNDAHSGAMIAYEEVLAAVMDAQVSIPPSLRGPGRADKFIPPSEGREWLDLATLVMTYDTWKKDSPLWDEARAATAALNLLGSKTVIGKVQDGTFVLQEVLGLGRVLFDKDRRKTALAAEGAEWGVTHVAGREVRIATFNNTDKLTSDIANALIEKGANVAAGYFYIVEAGEPKICVSVRSDDTASARRIAETYGGGGHDRAAGFSAPVESPSKVMARIRSALWRIAKEG